MRIKLPKIVPAGFNVLKPAESVSRQQRRHAKISVQGQEVEIMEYLKRKARSIPPVVNTETGKQFDHLTKLRAMYMIRGVKGVNQYLMAVRSVYVKDAGGPIPYRWKLLKRKIKSVLSYFKSPRP